MLIPIESTVFRSPWEVMVRCNGRCASRIFLPQYLCGFRFLARGSIYLHLLTPPPAVTPGSSPRSTIHCRTANLTTEIPTLRRGSPVTARVTYLMFPGPQDETTSALPITACGLMRFRWQML